MGNKVALVTGASAGLGKTFSEKLAQQGYDLYIVARRLEKLQDVAKELSEKYKVKVTPLGFDLSKKEDREKLYEATGGDNAEIDLLVNNAGLGFLKEFTQLERKDMLTMIELNVTAVADITHLYVRPMVKRKKGEMIIIASLSSFQPVPYFATYGATKGFDLLFGEALSYELSDHGIHVLTVCPGFTRTEFASATGVKDTSLFEKGMSAEEVVDMSLKALRKRKRVIITGFKNWFKVFIQRFFPRPLNSWFTAQMMKKSARKGGQH